MRRGGRVRAGLVRPGADPSKYRPRGWGLAQGPEAQAPDKTTSKPVRGGIGAATES